MKEFTEVKSFEDACQVEGLNPQEVVPAFAGHSPEEQKALIAHTKLVIIARALNRLANEGEIWRPDWSDDEQWKYYPWFEMGGSLGFRFADYDYWYSGSYVGSRLCFISQEVAVYAGEQFTELYKDYFTL